MDDTLAIGTALVLGLATGASPVALAEATALAAGSLPTVPARASVLVAFTAGHVAGKSLWYALGRLESRITRPALRQRLDQAKAFAAAHPAAGAGVTFSAATISLPPFHLLTLAAGIVRAPFRVFLPVAFAGRLLRFAGIAAFPMLWRG